RPAVAGRDPFLLPQPRPLRRRVAGRRGGEAGPQRQRAGLRRTGGRPRPPPQGRPPRAAGRAGDGGPVAGAVTPGTGPLIVTRRAARGALAAMLVAGARLAVAQPATPSSSLSGRGPLETREEWLVAQPHLTLPTLSPDPLPDGGTRIRIEGDWGNDFGWRWRFPGE